MLRAVPLLYHPDAATGRTDLWGALLPRMPDTVPLPEEPSPSIESVLRIMEIDVAMLLQNSILEEFLEGLHEDPGVGRRRPHRHRGGGHRRAARDRGPGGGRIDVSVPCCLRLR